MKVVYLAAPIDQAVGNTDLATKRRDIHNALYNIGATVYDPFAAWTNDPEAIDRAAARKIQDINMHALQHADLVLAVAPPGVPTVGVPLEVFWALDKTKAVVALWAGSKPSSAWLWLSEQYSPRVIMLYDLDRPALTALMATLEEVDIDDDEPW